MENELGKNCLFSGRFDCPNVGHIVQLRRLSHKFDKIFVPVLNYPEQRYPVQYRVQVLKEALDNPVFDIFSNNDHFGRIEKEQVETIIKQHGQFKVYASGNVACLKRMEELGYEVLYVNRAFDYSSTEDYLVSKIRSLL